MIFSFYNVPTHNKVVDGDRDDTVVAADRLMGKVGVYGIACLAAERTTGR